VAKVLKFGPYQGSAAAAIWDGETDDNPFNDPLHNLSRLYFHSALHYPKVVSTRTVTVSFPKLSSNQIREKTYTLFAHGQTGIPWIRGQTTVSGALVNLAGHVPIQSSFNTKWFGRPHGVFCRFVALGCDETNVVLHEYAQCAQNDTMAAMSLPVTVFIMDERLE
jgi:hypothetical protein